MKAIVTYDNSTSTGLTQTLDSSQAVSNALTDAQVKALFAPDFGEPTRNEIYFARILLKLEPFAKNIKVEIEEKQSAQRNGNNKGDPGAQMVLIMLAAILLIAVLPILIMFGMNGKLFLKKKYADRSGEGFDKFKKIYTIIGIVFYVAAIAMIVIGAVVPIGSLLSAGVGVLLGGAIVYYILSFVLTKKYITE